MAPISPSRSETTHFALRRARAEDAVTIRALVRQEHLDPTTLAWPNFVVAEDAAGQVIGIGQIKPLPGARELGSLVVVPAWRRRGVGAALMRALMAQARGPLYLVCRDGMAGYYRRFGFVEAEPRDLPWALRAKHVLMRLGRLLGLRGVVMRRMADDRLTTDDRRPTTEG